VFDREREWQGATAFAADPSRHATLGVVSRRRRQGKSYPLQALAQETCGLYFAATEATAAESLRLFADTLVRHTREPIEQPSGTGTTRSRTCSAGFTVSRPWSCWMSFRSFPGFRPRCLRSSSVSWAWAALVRQALPGWCYAGRR
jgi:hypothetical protein